jgi:hypothetical protein
MIYIQKKKHGGRRTQSAILDHPLFSETVGPENYSNVDGNHCINSEGMRKLALAIQAGTIPGNPEVAQYFLEFTEFERNL